MGKLRIDIKHYLAKLLRCRNVMISEISKSSNFIPYVINMHGSSIRKTKSERRSIRSKEDLETIKNYYQKLLDFNKKVSKESDPELLEQYKEEYKIFREIMSRKIMEIGIDFNIYTTFLKLMLESKPEFFSTIVGRKIDLTYKEFLDAAGKIQSGMEDLIRQKVRKTLEAHSMGQSDFEQIYGSISEDIDWFKIFGNIKPTNWELSTYVMPYVQRATSKYIALHKKEDDLGEIGTDKDGKIIVSPELEED